MTISVSAEPLNEPPRNEVTVSVPAGSVMSSVQVWRNDASGRSLLRQQPSPGFDSRTVYDYECPYGEQVTYGWSAEYTDPEDYATVWDEQWANLSNWSGASNWTVAGGAVRNSATTSTATPLARAVSAGASRVVFDRVYSNLGQVIQVVLRQDSSTFLRFTVQSSITSVEFVSGGSLVFSQSANLASTAQFTVDLFESSVVIADAFDNAVFVPQSLELSAVEFSLVVYGAAVQYGSDIEQVTVFAPPSAESVEEESDPVTLESDRAWLIHPSSTDLSFPLERASSSAAGIVSVEDVVNRSEASLHPILGARSSVAVTAGPRRDDETGMTVATVSASERAALRALLYSDFPILVQIPADWDVDFNCGFYSVGNTTERRPVQIGSEPWRETHLPLTRVQAPVADVAAVWTYTDVLLEFGSYAALQATFASYADLTTNTRS